MENDMDVTYRKIHRRLSTVMPTNEAKILLDHIVEDNAVRPKYADVLFGFVAYLTTMSTSVKVGATEDSTVLLGLMKDYLASQQLPIEVSPSYPDTLKEFKC